MSKEVYNKWRELLDDKRFRSKSTVAEIDGRNPFENDYGRLISSPSIRRLQDKTQVFPLSTSDFIRTRLTHSLEVSYFGGSIGQSVEDFLIKDEKLPPDMKGHLVSLLRVAGLVHDLGNPPFGHFGEEAIKTFFTKHFENFTDSKLSDIQKVDFCNFDGNVQTFRILKRLNYFGDKHSYNLSFPSIASIIKYPSDSISGNIGKHAAKIKQKKFGYFDSDAENYKTIDEHLGLNGNRHPIVYLLEAADDIAYSAADIEDGVKLGLLTFEQIREVFSEHLNENKDEVIRVLDDIYKSLGHLKGDRISLTSQKFRIFTQSKMIDGIIKVFKENYDLIIKGELESELLEISEFKDIRKSYKKLQYVVFNDKAILRKELAGHEALTGLLDIFVGVSHSSKFKNGGNNRESRLYKMISSSYRHIYEKHPSTNNDEYNRLQLIVDFISGMTDSYAVALYQTLKGIKF